MIGQITITLIPAAVILIFLPSCLFTHFEGWPYSVSVYYSFVTLSTIGFGDFIPTFQPHQVIENTQSDIQQQNGKLYLFNLFFTGTRIWHLFSILSNIRSNLVCIWFELYFDVNWFYCTWNAKQTNRSSRTTAERQY